MTFEWATQGTIRLKTFGSIELVDVHGKPILPVLTQPMRCALLAVLAVDSGLGFVSRDRLIAMFWPDAETTKGRHALNQQVYALRQQLSTVAIQSRGDDMLGIDPNHLCSDISEFERALAEGRPDAALNLYRGELLDGLYVSRAPAFEQWLDEHRTDVRRRASDAAWTIAHRRYEEGNAVAASVYAQRAAAMFPLDEGVLQQLLQFLDDIGHRTTAVREYEAFSERLTRELDLTPSPETQFLIDAIRRRAQVVDTPRLARVSHASDPEVRVSGESQDIREAGIVETSSGEHSLATEASSLRGSRWRRTIVVIAASAALLTLALVGYALTTRQATEPREWDPRHVAILYFEDLSPTGDLGWLVRRFTHDLINELGNVDSLRVVPAAGIESFGGPSVSPDSIARALGVGTIVDGSVRLDDDRLQVDVQLIDANSGFQLESRGFEQPWSALFDLQDAVLFDIGRFLRERVGYAFRTRQRMREAGDVEAWRLVSMGDEHRDRGLELGRQGESNVAWEYLRRADSMYALAEGIAPRWSEPPLLRARTARAMFLSLTLNDPIPGQPPGSAGQIAIARERLQIGLDHLARADRVKPGDPEIVGFRGYLLYSLWFVDGQPLPSEVLDQAEADVNAAVEADPSQALAWLALGRTLRYRGDPAGASYATRQAFDANPYLWEGRRAVGDLMIERLESGAIGEAHELCNAGRRSYPNDRTFAECRLQLLAWTADHPDSIGIAWQLLTDLEASGLATLADTWLLRRMYIAAAAARAGLADSAVSIIRLANENRRGTGSDSTAAALAQSWALVLAKAPERAVALLDSLTTADPDQRDHVRTHAWFRELRNHPAFEAITRPR